MDLVRSESPIFVVKQFLFFFSLKTTDRTRQIEKRSTMTQKFNKAKFKFQVSERDITKLTESSFVETTEVSRVSSHPKQAQDYC